MIDVRLHKQNRDSYSAVLKDFLERPESGVPSLQTVSTSLELQIHDMVQRIVRCAGCDKRTSSIWQMHFPNSFCELDFTLLAHFISYEVLSFLTSRTDMLMRALLWAHCFSLARGTSFGLAREAFLFSKISQDSEALSFYEALQLVCFCFSLCHLKIMLHRPCSEHEISSTHAFQTHTCHARALSIVTIHL